MPVPFYKLNVKQWSAGLYLRLGLLSAPGKEYLEYFLKRGEMGRIPNPD
jgi:hypothetical protein